MKFQDLYIIIIKIDDKEIKLDPVEYSLAIKDSIHQLYPSASVTFRDHTGMLQESLGFSNGLEISIGFGKDNTINTAPFSINYDYLDNPEFPGYLGGEVDIFLIHSMAFKQKIKSKAYKNRISKIVRQLMSGYNFKDLDINDTGNESVWYQPLINDAVFIQKKLLPYAFSSNASNTPFYSFITSDNVYHFRNYKSLFDAGAAATIEYKVVDNNSSKENSTINLKRWKNDFKSYYKNFNRQVFSIDKKNGDLIEKDDSIVDYPLENNLKLPIVDTIDDYTGYIDNWLNFDETGDKEAIKGFNIFSQKVSSFIDRFLLLQPFNPSLHAGLAVKFNVYSLANDGDQLSVTYSDLYLIEECEHIWDGQGQRAYTKLILGRKYINVPNTQMLKGKLK